MPDSSKPSDDVKDGVTVEAAMMTAGGVGLFIADFDDLDAAWEAYDQLNAAADGKRLSIEGVVVFKKLDHGSIEVQKLTDRSTKHGLTWGIVGGVVVGVLFPPTILGSAAVLGATGAGIGRLRHLHHQSDMAAELGKGVDVGHSGLMALVSDPAELEIERALAKANRVVSRAVDKATADDIRAEAASQEKDLPPSEDT